MWKKMISTIENIQKKKKKVIEIDRNVGEEKDK